MNARAAKLAAKIEVNPQTGAITLPKPEWNGWTLSQEMAAFDEQQRRSKLKLGYRDNSNDAEAIRRSH